MKEEPHFKGSIIAPQDQRLLHQPALFSSSREELLGTADLDNPPAGSWKQPPPLCLTTGEDHCPFPGTGFFLLFFCLFVLERHLQHIGVPRLGHIGAATVGLPAATAMWDPSHICDLHHSLRQHQILNPLSGARVKPASSKRLCSLLNPLGHNGNS